MAQIPFIIELKRLFPESDWTWILSGLHQDRRVWDGLQGDLGRNFLSKYQTQIEAYRPGVFCLMELGHPDPLEKLQLLDTKPAAEVYHLLTEEISPDTELTPLGEAGLQTLELLELWGVASSWDGLEHKLGRMTPSTAACIFSLLNDPVEFLAALVSNGQSVLAVHALLSSPTPHQSQAELLGKILDHTSPIEVLPLLRHLFVQRPVLAVSLGQKILQSPWWEQSKTQKIASPDITLLNDKYNHIMNLLFRAEIYRLAAQPNLSIPILYETIRLSRHLQAEVAAQLAQAAAEDDDWKSALSAWEQANHLDPDSLEHLGGFLMALVDGNQSDKAASRINEHPFALEYVNEKPVSLLIAQAELALQSGQLGKAQRYASEALEFLNTSLGSGSPSADIDPGSPVALARLFLEAAMPQDAVQSATTALLLKPDHVEACSVLAGSLAATGRLEEAIEYSHLAVGLAPDRMDLRLSLVDMMEAAQDWHSAFEQRSIIIERTSNPPTADLRKYAETALHAGEFRRAADICEQLLGEDNQDGAAIAILAQAVAQQGQKSDALALLSQVTQELPSSPYPWLALARIQLDSGEHSKAMETLRAASQAAQDEPDLLLELGRAHLHENAPTLALVPLRQAFHIMQTEQSDQWDKHLHSKVAFLLGQTLYQLGHIEEARHALEIAYLTAPYDVEIAYVYAQLLLDLDETQIAPDAVALSAPHTALQPLETVIASNPNNPQPYLDYARCVLRMDGLVQDENYRHALDYLGLAAEVAPNLPEIKAYSAEIMAASGDLVPAVSAYRKALETPLAKEPPWQIRLWLGLGKVALDLGQIETAVAALQEASLAGPESPDVFRFLSEAYDAAGLVENAFEAAQSARDLAIEDIDFLIWFAQKAHHLQGRSGVFLPNAREEAVHALEQATRQATLQPETLTRLGEIQLQLGVTEAAHNTFRRLIGQGDEEIPGFPLDPSPTDLHKAALGLLEIGDSIAAVACLERALQHDLEVYPKVDQNRQSKTPLRIHILTDLASALQLSGQSLASLQALEQAIQLDPARVELYMLKADLLANLEDGDSGQELGSLDRYGIACDALEAALDIEPQNASLHIRIALVLRKMGEILRAVEHAQQAVDLAGETQSGEEHPDRLLTSHLLAADLAYTVLQYDRAAKILGDLTAEIDGCAINHKLEYYCLRAELLMEEHEFDRAAVEIARAVELNPEDPGLLALQVRLGSLKISTLTDGGAATTASSTRDIFDLAMEKYSSPPSKKSRGRESDNLPDIVWDHAARRRLARAAQELHHWDIALEIAHQNAKSVPDEPSPHLELARIQVLRAEFQRSCQALEVINHAPGDVALSEEAFAEYQFAIQITEDLIHQWQKPSRHRKTDAGPDAASLHALSLLKQWQVRGTAIFCPNKQCTDELAALPPNPENVVAQIGCLQTAGDINSAGKVASQYAHSPAVLAQLAIALTESKPRQALVAAQGALEALFSTDSSIGGKPAPAHGAEQHNRLLSSIDVPMIFALLGKLLHIQNEPSDDPSTAIQAIQKALASWPDEPRWQYLAAEMYLRHPLMDKTEAAEAAIAHLEQAIQLDPEHADSYKVLGTLYEKRGEHGKAVHLLKMAASLEPRDTEIWMKLAEVHHELGNLEDAVFCAEKAAALSPKHTKPLILLADMELEGNKPEKAKARAQTALDIEPDNPEALVLTAKALKALEQPAEAIDLLEKALPVVSEPLPLHLEYIQLIQKARGVKVALDAAKDLSDSYPEDSRVLSLLAEILESDGQIQTAVQTAQKALRCRNCLDTLSKEELAFLHYNLGRLLGQTGQLDQSIHQLVEALDNHPDYIEAYLELGHVHQQRRQHAQALQAFSQAIDVAPSDSRPYYYAGLALKESKDYLKAERMLRKASELAPEDVSIHRLLGAVVALNLVHNRHQPSIAG